MTVKHTKSAAIILFDATVPPITATAGEGGPASLKEVSGFLTVPGSAAVDSTLRFVRVPSTAKIKSVRYQTQAQAGSGTVLDIGVYYPTTGLTGLPDLAANAIDQNFFASAVGLENLVAPTDVTNESATYTADKWNQPLWQALGIATDPGGYFDIVGTVLTADVTTGTGIAGLSVTFTN